MGTPVHFFRPMQRVLLLLLLLSLMSYCCSSTSSYMSSGFEGEARAMTIKTARLAHFDWTPTRFINPSQGLRIEVFGVKIKITKHLNHAHAEYKLTYREYYTWRAARTTVMQRLFLSQRSFDIGWTGTLRPYRKSLSSWAAHNNTMFTAG